MERATKPTEIFQMEYRVDGEWLPTEYKMPLAHAEEHIVESDWRPILETVEVRQPGELLIVPVTAHRNANLMRWSEEDLAEYRNMNSTADPGAADETRRVLREDDEAQWWVDVPQKPRPKPGSGVNLGASHE